MKIYNKLIYVFLFFSTLLSANLFYINEPILNSKVYVETHGNPNNEVIVFVHGLGDEASTIWKNSIDKFKNDYYIITFDLPGFGKSSKDSAEYTPEKYALVVDYLISKYTSKQVYLVGHSMGGAIALKYTQLYESKIKKLLLIDVAGILHKDAYSQFLIKAGIDKFFNVENSNFITNKISNLFSNISSGLNKLVPGNLYDIVRTDYLRDNLFQSNPSSIAAVGLVTETFFNIEKINTPTIILWGEKDEVAPIRTGYVLNKLIKNSTLKIIKDSGHVPIIDSKEIYLDYLEKFLTNNIENKPKKVNKILYEKLEVNKQNNLLLECNSKSIKIINSNNIKIKDCNLEDMYIENSSVWIINSNIYAKETALEIINSKVNITASDISGKIAVDTASSKLDFAAVNIKSSEVAILSKRTNQIIFSLTTLRSPITNKILHKKIAMKNNNKL